MKKHKIIFFLTYTIFNFSCSNERVINENVSETKVYKLDTFYYDENDTLAGKSFLDSTNKWNFFK